MRFSRFVAPIDKKALVLQLRRPLRLLGVSFAAPLLVALFYRDWVEALVFLAVGTTVFALGRKPDRENVVSLASRDALVLGASVYLLFALVGAVVYLPVAPFIDGLFESMSGFTTTGLSVLDADTLPKSLIFFRSYSQWIGGAGIVVLSIVFLPGPRSTLAHLFATEFKDENLLGNIVATMRMVFVIYGLLTLSAMLAYVLVGMDLFEALIHALSTLSTGGFSSHSESIGFYSTVKVQLAVSLFMLTGAIAFPLYYRARRDGIGRFFADPQLLALLGLVGLAFLSALVFAGWRERSGTSVTYLFHSVSALTTTGFSITETSEWPEGFRLVIIVLMWIGGSAGSTSGGIKLVRLLLVARLVGWFLIRALLPQEAQVPVRQAGQAVKEDEVRGALGFLGLYAAVLIVSTVLLASGGFSPMDSMFEATSALGTVGLSTGITSATMPAWAKLLLIVDMWAGRLEILPLLVFFYPGHWRSK